MLLNIVDDIHWAALRMAIKQAHSVIVDLEIDVIDFAIIAEIFDNASSCGFENVVIVKG